ncbi:Gfo/Idh/MocA family oxidoreductase [Thermithiobacillus plumbiphilus]|uniref:Gfo/Idh/MocA family oxidoreductase n=1 Tax=Thermithiobacillus plumbiphilus TaxID=1729899 RepID=A0ABU9D3P7_9PROT
MDRLPVAVIGVGHLGRFHAQKYRDHPRADLVGVYDLDAERARVVAEEVGATPSTDLAALLARVKAVSVVTPTLTHHDVVRQCLEANVHVLVEKPFTATLDQADELIALQKARQLVLAVGHLKRLHPAIEHLRSLNLGSPRYIEAERLAPFKPRSLDVDVIMDLMIHDLDLALHLSGSACTDLRAVGVPVITDKLDMANAWLDFDNGAVGTFASSRVVRETSRKLRLFWQDAYASIDFAANSLSVSRRHPAATGGMIPGVDTTQVDLPRVDVLAREVDNFLVAVETGDRVFCDAEDGRAALALALQVQKTTLDRFHAGMRGR